MVKLLLYKQENQSSDSQDQVKASAHVSSPRLQPPHGSNLPRKADRTSWLMRSLRLASSGFD